ncbi:DUF637 domain-containing protein [Vibrio rhizosphaerae]|uniref:DUF637 domain-containing protein n=1 Tax=Vibrio rhizosphaerae TaxID=398736 RepID=UPI00056FB045|nr:DUF637 domain-containing protein [Vibrio rhizosphaerae]
MMKNKKIPLWQSLTSSVLLPVLLTHMAFPVYAAAQQHVALESITNSVAASARYRLQEQVRDYLYAGAIEKDELAIFDGFEFFFTQIKASYPEMLSAYQGANTTLDDIPTRFGTPYVERGIIRDQLIQLLNKSWISAPGYSSYNEQTKKLYENAVSYAKSAGKKLGELLSEEQISQLPADMIWPEIRVVNGHEYLVPFVYLVPKTIEQQRLTESTLTAGSADIHTNSFVVNGAHVDIKHKALLDITHDFINTKGTISGGQLTIRTGRDLQNLSGTITGDDVSLIANRLVNDTLVTRLDYGHGYAESFDQIGSIVSLGDLNIRTSSDVLSHGGQFSAQGDLKIRSEGNIILVPQVTKSDRKESGQHWSESESSLVNLQTHLSAIDTLSLISGGEVYIEGAVLESQGLLEILAAHGITLKSAADMHSFDSRFQAESGGMFGTKESESESRNEAEIVRTLLKAGQSLVLRTLQGNVLLEAVTVDSLGISKIIADNGEIDFELAKLLDTYSYEHSYDGALAFRHRAHGHQREVAYYSEFINSGGIMLDAYNGVRIQYAGDKHNLDSTLATLAQSPELAWMQDIRNDPSLNVNWQEVQLVMEEWDYDQSGLTPAGMAVIAIAMAIATGGASSPVIAGEGPLYTAINAGIHALANQAMTSLVDNGFDFTATLKDLSSRKTIVSLAITMVSAGVIKEVDAHLFTEGTNAAKVFQDATTVNIASNSIEAQAIQAIVHSVVNASVKTVIEGGNLDDFADTFITNTNSSMVSIVGASLADKISDAAGHKGITPTNPTGKPQIDAAVEYVAHAGLGCGIGLMSKGINGAFDHSEYAEGCATGMAGGVISEYIADHYTGAIVKTDQMLKKWTRSVFGFMTFCPKNIEKLVDLMHEQAIDLPKYSAAAAFWAFNIDSSIAEQTANNAIQKNALYLLALASDGDAGKIETSGDDDDSCIIEF